MIDRHHVEAMLRANGLPPTAPDEEIRALLLGARWDNSDVETALTVLCTSKSEQTTTIDTVHQVFRNDQHLSPTEINSLLGVAVTLTAEDLKDPSEHRRADDRKLMTTSLVCGLILVILSLTLLMYVEKVGPFHASASYSKSE